MEATTNKTRNRPTRAIYSEPECFLKSCGKRFTPKVHNQKYCSSTCQLAQGKKAYQDGIKKRQNGGMHFGKVAGSPAQRRILKLLQDKLPHTTRQIQQKANVCNPATWISALNMQGYNIECKYRSKSKDGARIYYYQLKEKKRKK